MNLRHVTVATLLSAAVLAPSIAAAKDDKKAPPPAKTGVFQLEGKSPTAYTLMSVPKDYDAKKWYPLLFFLHAMSSDPKSNAPEPYVGELGPEFNRRGWIVAAPKEPEYNTDFTADAIRSALRSVAAAYHLDERRVVLAGYTAGANMAWQVAARSPVNWAAVVALGGELRKEDRSQLKGFAGKSAYLFRGERDGFYTDALMKEDKQVLEAFHVAVTTVTKKDWKNEFPTPDVKAIADWCDKVWPAGGWREKAEAITKAVADKEFAAASKGLESLAADLKKTPYPAFSQRAADLEQSMLEAGRALIEGARSGADSAPLEALAAMEAVAKQLKGAKTLDDEAQKALAALRKQPAVVEAVKKKEAEAQGASYMESAAAAEAKGDLAQALAAYRRAAALEWSRKTEAVQKVADLEHKVEGK